ncbi:hypothetical protein FGO68_gene1278 [Halteria grandinella]|uniref:Uncharacterized protein n=1 Tax=Halteria grandinella TaxID=5974 RepID=A0A8J8NSK4_HALGN|nr:hypothetical protein FGO68_gene1278 [Halteria grandinella]
MTNTQTNGFTSGGKNIQSNELPQQRLKSETRQLQLNCHQSTQNTCDNSLNESTVVAPKLADPKPTSKLPWLSAYKVNFNKFVKNVLNGDLRNLSLQDQSIELHLKRFLLPGTIEAFLSNNEKHFRMQFVIELVHALIDCIKNIQKRNASVSHNVRCSNSIENEQMQIEDARSSLLRDVQILKEKEQQYSKMCKLEQMKVNDAMREIKYLREHQEKLHKEELQKIQSFRLQFETYIKEREEDLKNREVRLITIEQDLKEKEKVITQLMVAGGASSNQQDEVRGHQKKPSGLGIGLGLNMESTFGSIKNKTISFDAILAKFDPYKEEVEQKERDLARFLTKHRPQSSIDSMSDYSWYQQKEPYKHLTENIPDYATTTSKNNDRGGNMVTLQDLQSILRLPSPMSAQNSKFMHQRQLSSPNPHQGGGEQSYGSKK